jgi:uridine kinase
MIDPPQQPAAPIVLGIAGCSGSGKTTLAARLASLLGGLHFHFDNYYRDLAHLPPDKRALVNFDDPATLEEPLLTAHVAALARGEQIEQPLYDFSTHSRVPGRTQPLQAPGYLIVEGIFALYYPELVPLHHLRVFIDAPPKLCYARRLHRDVHLRGRSPESIRAQWETTVLPSAERFILPTADRADLLLAEIAATEDIDRKAEQVLAALRARGLLRHRPDQTEQ